MGSRQLVPRLATCLAARLATGWTWIFVLWLAGPVVAGETVQRRDASRRETQVRVPARDGEVSWRDLISGIAGARGYDDRALAEKIPGCRFDTDDCWFRALSHCVERATDRDIAVRVERDEATGRESVSVEWDREALTQRRREVKDRMRHWVLDGRSLLDFDFDSDFEADAKPKPKPARKPARTPYGLHWDDAWVRRADPSLPLVVSIHGFNSRPQSVDVLIAAPRESGYPTATYAYPNDQAITASAAKLAADLQRFHRRHPQRSIALVTHSMGGLVAREVVEHPRWLALDGTGNGSTKQPLNVSHLIMVAPPNYGTQLAHFSYASDCWEYLWPGNRPEGLDWVFRCVEDGLDEASHDLEPNSIFLSQMNARPRNPHIRYTIFLGDRGGGPARHLKSFQLPIQRASRGSDWIRIACSKHERLLREMDEIKPGQGDGVVSLDRGQLEGVDDVEVFTFRHDTVVNRQAQDDSPLVWRGILERLASP